MLTIILLHVNINNSHVNTDKMYVNINKVHANSPVEIIHLACTEISNDNVKHITFDRNDNINNQKNHHYHDVTLSNCHTNKTKTTTTKQQQQQNKNNNNITTTTTTT